jgi:hypothetical protein
MESRKVQFRPMRQPDVHGIGAAELRAAANAPEVHAAALTAAKDYLLSRGSELRDMPSSDMAATIAMHAALILRAYLDAVGEPGLVAEVARAKAGGVISEPGAAADGGA